MVCRRRPDFRRAPAITLFFFFCAVCCLPCAVASQDDSPRLHAATFPVVYRRSEGRWWSTARRNAVLRRINEDDVDDEMPRPGVATPKASEKTMSSDRLQFPLAEASEGFGEYLAVLRIGTPPQPAAVAIDTGSQLLWVQCHPCIECGAQAHGFDVFDPSRSDSYSPITCDDCRGDSSVATVCKPQAAAAREPRLAAVAAAAQGDQCIYAVTYGDRSNSTGFLSAETLSINGRGGGGSDGGGAGTRVHDVIFGCGLVNTGLVSTLSASGLLGLDRGRFSLISQLRVDTFSYCLPQRRSGGGGGGFLTLGPAPASDLQYTPLLQNTQSEFHAQFYYLNLTGISVGGKMLGIPSSAPMSMGGGVAAAPTIIDSGTTMTSLVHEAYEELARAFDEGMAATGAEQVAADGEAPFSLCYRVPIWRRQPPSPPPVTFHFAGAADLRLQSHHLLAFVGADVSSRYYCMAFIDSGSSPSATNYIGNFQQQDFIVEYDLAGARIGFAPSACSGVAPGQERRRRNATPLAILGSLLLLLVEVVLMT